MDKFNGLGIVFSIDSFTPETYEQLRVGAKFEKVMGNLRRLTEVCRKGPDRSVRVQSCIMKSNFLELTHMLAYAVREGLNVSFSPVLVWPPNEIINVFADFAEESKGWEEELTRAQDFIDAEIARGNQTFASSSLYNPRDTIHEVADIFRQAQKRYADPHKVRVHIEEITVPRRLPDEALESFFHNEGYCYITGIIKKYDGVNINCVVCEDGRPLPYAGVIHDDIRKKGEGRYSIWPGEVRGEHYILLSATDNRDPRTNGKKYTLQYQITSPTDRFGRKREPMLVAVEKGNHGNILSYLKLEGPGEFFIDIPRDVDLNKVIFYTVADYLDYSERNFINRVELNGGVLRVDLQVIREDRKEQPARAEALVSPVVAAAEAAQVHPGGAAAGNGLAEIIRGYQFPNYAPAAYNEALVALLDRGRNFNSSFIYDAIIHYRYRQVMERYLAGPPECTLQVGPGGSLGCEVLLALWGVKKACTIDPFPLLAFDLDLFMKTLGAFFEVMRWFNGNGGPAAPRHQTLGDGHFAVGDSVIRHYYPRSFEDLRLPDGGIDFLFSHATLEHVRDPHTCIAETWRVLRPGGLTAHCIDLRDHRNFEQPLAYLQWPDEAWDRLMERHCRGDGSLYQNRWRANEFREAFSQAGFEVLEYRPELQVDPDRLAAELPRFDPKYRHFPLEDLAITTIFIVAQKPIWVHQSQEMPHVRHCGRN
jgi:SAM-dependent methyltransferase